MNTSNPNALVFVAHATESLEEAKVVMAALQGRSFKTTPWLGETQASGKLEHLVCITAFSNEAGQQICQYAQGFADGWRKR
jgi:hypothetical protein